MSNKAIILAFALYFFFPSISYAYLDMGTGSYIIQAILAGFFAGLFFIKIYWFKFSKFISKLFGRAKED